MNTRIANLGRIHKGRALTVTAIHLDGCWYLDVLGRKGKALHKGLLASPDALPVAPGDLLRFLEANECSVDYMDLEDGTFCMDAMVDNRAALLEWLRHPEEHVLLAPLPEVHLDLTCPHPRPVVRALNMRNMARGGSAEPALSSAGLPTEATRAFTTGKQPSFGLYSGPTHYKCESCGSDRGLSVRAAGRDYHLCRPCFARKENVLNVMQDAYLEDND